MRVLYEAFVVCLLASCHGIANSAAINAANKQETEATSAAEAKIGLVMAASNLSENIVSRPLTTVSRVTKILQIPSPQLRTIHETSVAAVTSTSTSIHPTRTGDDTSRPAGSSTVSSHIHSPIMTTIPENNLAPLYLEWPGDVDPEDLIPLYQDLVENDNAELVPRNSYDDNDGYGFGYGSSTSGPVNGGYGHPSGSTYVSSGSTNVPSEPTNAPSGGYGNHPQPTQATQLPSGGYGNPPLPDIVNPTFVTLPDPPTVTVSLEVWSSTFDPSTSTNGATVIVVEPAPTTEVPVPNVTVVTVAPSEATLPLPLPTVGPSTTTMVVPVPTETVHSSPGYVYTTVAPSYTGPHAVTSTFVIVHTPTAHPTPATPAPIAPKPTPVGTNAGRRVQPNLRFSWAMVFLTSTIYAATGAINGLKRDNDPKSTRSKRCEH
ncbi:hypothetical protein F5B19DRAFT_389159 [Rostrohypoxylon terebratum]|nr:hypothetical protein F5B19DRAFT_389159 [Rostrohypoxylon terebratum]